MTRYEAKLIDLALAILRRNCESTKHKPDRGLATQLAMRVLLPHVGKHDLITFWIVLGNDNPLQRLNHLKKLYATIESRARDR